jgi:hypothetical protein
MDNLEGEVIRHTEQIKTLFGRTEQLEKIVESVNALALSVKELTLGQSSMMASIKGLRTDVDALKDEPGKKWKDITGKVLWLVLAAALGVVLGKFGLS